MGLTREEQETIIRFDEATKEAELYTASPIVYRRMIKRGFKAEVLDNKSWTFSIPRKAVRLPSKPRQLSKELKAKMSERAKTLFGKKKEEVL